MDSGELITLPRCATSGGESGGCGGRGSGVGQGLERNGRGSALLEKGKVEVRGTYLG